MEQKLEDKIIIEPEQFQYTWKILDISGKIINITAAQPQLLNRSTIIPSIQISGSSLSRLPMPTAYITSSIGHSEVPSSHIETTQVPSSDMEASQVLDVVCEEEVMNVEPSSLLHYVQNPDNLTVLQYVPRVVNKPKIIKKKRPGNKKIKEPKKPAPKVFRSSWLELNDYGLWLQPVENNPALAYCACCEKSFGAGKSEIDKHSVGVRHCSNLELYKKSGHLGNAKIDSETMKQKKIMDAKVRVAEAKMSAFFTDHNFPKPAIERMIQLMKEVFVDSQVVTHMQPNRTWTIE